MVGPSARLKVSLREDVPGEVYLLTLTVRPGWNEGGQDEPVVTIHLPERGEPIRAFPSRSSIGRALAGEVMVERGGSLNPPEPR